MGMQLPDFEGKDENRKDSSNAPEAIQEAAGKLPSNLQELKQAADITRQMREGTSAGSSAAEEALNNLLKNAPSGIAKGISDALSGKSGSSEKQHRDSGSPESGPNIIRSKDGKPTQGQGGDSGGGPGERHEKPRISDGAELLKELATRLPEVISSDKQGVMKLSTGDTYIRNNGTEILVSPKGEVLMVNKDGSIDLGDTKGVKIQHNKKSDETTLTYPNGDTVVVSGNRITEVTRGNQSVVMASPKSNFHPRDFYKLPEFQEHYNNNLERLKDAPKSVPPSEKNGQDTIPLGSGQLQDVLNRFKQK